jgi:pyruvate dehydrogenase E1 component
MMETVDGEYQNCKAFGGKYTRDNFFGKYPETAALVANMSDDDVWRLNRGGHDPHKVYAATSSPAKPRHATVILAKTVKGYGMGQAGEALNPTHQTKKLDDDAVPHLPRPLQHPGHRRPAQGQRGSVLPPRQGLAGSRSTCTSAARPLGGYLPQRRRKSTQIAGSAPSSEAFDRLLKSHRRARDQHHHGLRAGCSTSPCATSRSARAACRSSRTRRAPSAWKACSASSASTPARQNYKPVDRDQLMYYREDAAGQVLEEGITECGAFSSWLACATSYSTNDLQMLPFYIYYSMFGMQRIGDSAWQAADMRARGFLLGATAGRTTLNGEGLQHETATATCCPARSPTAAATTRPSASKSR